MLNTKVSTPLAANRPTVYIPQHNHLMMARFDPANPEFFGQVFKAGDVLPVAYIHALNGRTVAETTLTFKQPATLYFSVSVLFPGLYYIERHSEQLGRFGCSCLEGKSNGWCQHLEHIEQIASGDVA